MDHTALRVMVAVAQEGNLTRAAERLHMTQPALSLQLKKLQHEVNLVLFERTSRGMKLTDDGRRLLPAAQRAVQSMTEFRSAAMGLAGVVHGEVKIGTIVDPEFLRLGGFLRHLVNLHPGLSFELQHGVSGAVARSVEQGRLDAAFTLGSPGLPELQQHFQVQSLADFRYRVIAPPGWQSRVKGQDWGELAQMPWISTPPESVHSRLLKHIYDDLGLSRRIVARVDVESSMLDLVKSGVALALARENLAFQVAHEAGVVIADSVAIPATLGFICRLDRAKEPPIAAIFEAVRQVWECSEAQR
ncbi:MAG: LysR family transcriptional regulator [Saccharospirillum sp.]|nr:LysR family transcriptional regulator [Saccharospirillum sp.]